MSSNSKSGRKKSSRKKSSRKKSSSRDQLRSKSEIPVVDTADDEDRTNLLAMVLGMVTTMVLVFGLFSDRVVNEKYDKEKERRAEKRRAEKKADSLEELLIKLADLGVKKSRSFSDSASNCKERIAISEEILERGPADENMREQAVCNSILAHVKLYGLDFTEKLGITDIGSDLKAAYTPYLEDSNAAIYENARIALLTHRSFEHMKSKSSNVAEMAALFSDTIQRFPEGKQVASMIQLHFLVLVESDPTYATELFARLKQQNPLAELKPTMARTMRNISDTIKLNKEGFGRKFGDRWANGMAGRRELIKTASRLLGETDLGTLMIRELSVLAGWFERNEFFEEAMAVYEELAKAADRGNIIAEYQELAERTARNGITRLGMVGKAIDFYAVDSAGQQLLDAEIKKKVVIVLYWSGSSEESIRYLIELNEGARTFGSKPVTILAVCVDKELPTVAKQMRKSPMLRILEPNFQSGRNSLLEQCPPPETLPHLVLVNFGGEIHDVNADPMQIKNKAMTLLLNRNRQ